MKRLKILIAALMIGATLVLMLSGCNMNAYEYKEVEGGYIITRYRGSEANITVPDEYNGKPVYGTEGTKENPVFNSGKIKSISYPRGVTIFGAYSVAGCKNLESILLSESVTGKNNAVIDAPKAVVNCEAFLAGNGWELNWNPQNNKVIWHSSQGVPEDKALYGMVTTVEKNPLDVAMDKPCATVSLPMDSNDPELYNIYKTLINMSLDDIKNLKPGQFVEFFLSYDEVYGYIGYDVGKTNWVEQPTEGIITYTFFIEPALKNPRGLFAIIDGNSKTGDTNTYYALVENAGMSVDEINQLKRGELVEFNYRLDKDSGYYICYNLKKQG